MSLITFQIFMNLVSILGLQDKDMLGFIIDINNPLIILFAIINNIFLALFMIHNKAEAKKY